MKPNGMITNKLSRLGGLSFGAYLWSDHNLIRVPLWNYINFAEVFVCEGIRKILYFILTVAMIFLIGCLIEAGRKKIEHALHVERIFERLDQFQLPY